MHEIRALDILVKRSTPLDFSGVDGCSIPRTGHQCINPEMPDEHRLNMGLLCYLSRGLRSEVVADEDVIGEPVSGLILESMKIETPQGWKTGT